MSTISYTNTIEDFIEFNIYNNDNNTQLKRRQKMVYYLFPAIWICLGVFNLIIQNHLSDMILWVTLSVLWLIFLPLYYKWKTKKNILKFYMKDENKKMLGKHQIEFNNEYIEENGDFGNIKRKWSGVHKIISINNYIFIYLDSIMAFVIPKDSFPSNKDMEKFLETVKNYISSSIG